MAEALYRPNVAALVLNNHGELLVCERFGTKGAWQFPQGGVDSGEKRRQALRRELCEEIGLSRSGYTVIAKRKGYRYNYPSLRHKKGLVYKGQEQTYYLCRLHPKGAKINLFTSLCPEFRRYKWISPHAFKRSWLPRFKREVYAAVLKDFFNATMV